MQRRQLLANQPRYLKEFAVKFSDRCIFVSADDKAVIPVGESEHAVSTVVRAHNPSLGPANPETVIGALYHDWKIAGIVPSVNLFVDVPEAAEESLFSGNAKVTLKDRKFQKIRDAMDVKTNTIVGYRWWR